MIWDSTAIARLAELRALGFSFSRIAAALGTTRNAVSGAISRRGLYTKRVARSRPIAPDAPEVPGIRECRYIFDDGPWRERLPQWCRHRTVGDSPYCATHFDCCYIMRK